MSKGVAIDKVILLLLGIIVLALIGYLLYTTFVGAGSAQRICEAALVSACGQCKLLGWPNTQDVKVSLTACRADVASQLGAYLTVSGETGIFNCANEENKKFCRLRGIQ
ncbi:MAG: hypothetical protein RMJ17_00780 [Candidatus Aenigmarchaeota archaeon]|nr:hypothetical protein [Candidatus Aenigmarchaeota archaeon]MDW8149120.1 hypothetical protein [Candidatus Aenigmarchaeota archaeon]